MSQIEKFICLRVFDAFWVNHLENMEHLKDSVRLRAYGKKDPLVEYKREGYKMFKGLFSEIELAIANTIAKAKLTFQGAQTKNNLRSRQYSPVSKKNKPKRNDPCPCGSGKKYKKCCYPKYG